MFERPLALLLFLAMPLVLAPVLLAAWRGRWLYAALSGALRTICFAAIVLMLAGFKLPVLSSAHRMTVVVAMDQSQSIARDQRHWMNHELDAIRHGMDVHDRLAVLGFGRDSQVLSPPSDPRLLNISQSKVVSSATDIAGALMSASGMFPAGDEKRLILLTDGNQTLGDALDVLPALSQQHVRVFTAAPPPSATARVALTGFEAPASVRAGSSFALHIDVQSEAKGPVPARIDLYGDNRALGSQTVQLRPGINRFVLPYRISQPGAYLMKARVDVPQPLVAIDPAAETAVSVTPPPRVLLISSTPPESLLKALKERQYVVEQSAPRGLPTNPAAYLAYQAVIIANVPKEALSEGFQEAINYYVANYGGGLIVTGNTLRDYKYHGSELEKTLPTDFEPQPPPPSREPIAVYLLIDRSNSMSYNSRYPAVRDYERIRYAKEAALALLNQLDDTDYAGVIAFDSEPYVLGHLRPLGEDRAQLDARIERLEPGGGTDFLEALEIAEREIMASGLPVREVILLTDGDTNRQYHDHDAIMATYAKEKIPVSTIRIGPDLENLRLLQDFARMTGGVFYRVEDIRKLPQLLVHLTHEAQNYKRHQRSRIDIGAHSSILNGLTSAQIPPIDFYALTKPKEGAEVPLILDEGSRTVPLLATWQYELGRSAVFAADPDSMGSLSWIRWDHYAEFWSQLVSWVARPGDSGPFTLQVSDEPDGSLRIEALKADAAPVSNLFCRISGPHRATDVPMSQSGPSLYEGESGPLPPGKYNAALIVKAGDLEHMLIHRQIAVPGAQAADTAELRIGPPNVGLLREIALQTGGAYDAPVSEMVRHHGATVITYRSVDSWLVPLVIVLLLADVFVRRRFIGD
jgi:Ca-activated chloride channel family protein